MYMRAHLVANRWLRLGQFRDDFRTFQILATTTFPRKFRATNRFTEDYHHKSSVISVRRLD